MKLLLIHKTLFVKLNRLIPNRLYKKAVKSNFQEHLFPVLFPFTILFSFFFFFINLLWGLSTHPRDQRYMIECKWQFFFKIKPHYIWLNQDALSFIIHFCQSVPVHISSHASFRFSTSQRRKPRRNVSAKQDWNKWHRI